MATYIEGAYQQDPSKGAELLGTGRAYIYKSTATVATYTSHLKVRLTPSERAFCFVHPRSRRSEHGGMCTQDSLETVMQGQALGAEELTHSVESIAHRAMVLKLHAGLAHLDSVQAANPFSAATHGTSPLALLVKLCSMP